MIAAKPSAWYRCVTKHDFKERMVKIPTILYHPTRQAIWLVYRVQSVQDVFLSMTSIPCRRRFSGMSHKTALPPSVAARYSPLTGRSMPRLIQFPSKSDAIGGTVDRSIIERKCNDARGTSLGSVTIVLRPLMFRSVRRWRMGSMLEPP